MVFWFLTFGQDDEEEAAQNYKEECSVILADLFLVILAAGQKPEAPTGASNKGHVEDATIWSCKTLMPYRHSIAHGLIDITACGRHFATWYAFPVHTPY